MSLQVWLPLNGDLHNQGLSGLTFSALDSYCISNNSGKIGKCYNNDAPAWDRGGLRSNTTINLGQNQSMFCWVNFTTLDSNSSLGGGIISQHRHVNNTGMGLTIKYASSTTGYLSVNTGTGSSRTYNTYCATTLMQAGIWYHVGYTYDGTTLKLYVNGKVEKTQAISGMSVSAEYLTVFCWSMAGSSGSDVYTGHFKLNGKINDVRIYNHCLSPKEVEKIAKGLVLHYKLDDRTNQTGTNLLSVALATTTGGWGKWVSSGATSPTMSYTTVDGYKCCLTTYPTQSSGWSGCGPYITLSAITANVVYTFSAFVKAANVDSIGKKLTISAWNNDNVYIADKCKRPTFTLTNDWQRVESQICLSASKQPMIGFNYEYATNNGSGISFYVTQLQWEQNEKAYPIWLPGGTSYTNTTVYDSSGYFNNGTIVGSLTVATGSPRYDVATVFNGSSYTTDTTTLSLSSATQLTVSCWAKPTEANLNNLFGLSYTGYYWQFVSGTDSSLEIRDSSTGLTGSRKSYAWPVVTAGQWVHIVCTYNVGTVKVYKNGELYSTNTTGGTKLNDSINMFDVGNSQSTRFNGQISDFRIYTTALTDGTNNTPNQIKELYTTSMSIDSNGNVYARELSEL